MDKRQRYTDVRVSMDEIRRAVYRVADKGGGRSKVKAWAISFLAEEPVGLLVGEADAIGKGLNILTRRTGSVIVAR